MAHADIYKYLDAAGKLYITDQKLGQPYRLIGTFDFQSKQQLWDNRFNSKTYRNNINLFLPHIKKAAKEHNLDPALLHAIVDTESSFNPKAQSKRGAIGLMQLMPETARSLGVKDSWNPAENIHGGALYFRQLLNKFNQDIKLSLAAYNAGEGAVKRAGSVIPNYPETQNYVKKVIRKYSKLKESI